MELKSLEVCYGRREVIPCFDLTVAGGSLVGIIGPNGAGKTTLLRAVMGMSVRVRGSIRIGDVDIAPLTTHQRARGYVGIVPEGRRLFAGLSVEENLELGAFRFRRDRRHVRELSESIYSAFPLLYEVRKQKCTELSGGQQQMVAIGRMVANDPQVMLLDEPSLGLSPIVVSQIIGGLQQLKTAGKAILVVEQRLDVLTELCSVVQVMVGGRKIWEGNVASGEVDPAMIMERYLG